MYMICGTLGICVTYCVIIGCLKQCWESARDDDYQENNTSRTEGNTQSKYELYMSSTAKELEQRENERHKNNFNSMQHNLPSNFQTNTYGVNNHMTPGENQNKRQEKNFNSAAIDMPAKPELNNSPSNFQTNTNGTNNRMPSSRYPFVEPSGSQNERQENNFNPGFNPTFNPAAIEMPPNPEYEARNNFPSNFQTNNYGANNHMTSSCNLPYSLTPGEANGNQNGSEPAYAGGWVNQSYKHTE